MMDGFVRRLAGCSALAMLLTPTLASAQGIAFAFDMRFTSNNTQNLFSFPVNDPLDQTQIGPIGDTGYETFAMDFNTAGTRLHLIDHSISNEALRLGTVNYRTGAFTPGPTISGGGFQGANPTGLSVDPTDETFFASRTNQLFTIDPATGVANFIGIFRDQSGTGLGTVIDIAVDNNGVLYAHVLGISNNNGGGLWRVDKTTGIAEFVGFNGIPTNFAQGMDFDPTTNMLYAALYTTNGNGSYGTWDTETGAWTEILPLINFPDPSGNGRELELAIRIPTPAGALLLGMGGLVATFRRRTT